MGKLGRIRMYLETGFLKQVPMSSHDQQEANLRWIRDHSAGFQRNSIPVPAQRSPLLPPSYPLPPRSVSITPYPSLPAECVDFDPRLLPPQPTFVPQSPPPSSLPLPPNPVRNADTRYLPPRPVKLRYYPSPAADLNPQRSNFQSLPDLSIPPPLSSSAPLRHPIRTRVQPSIAPQNSFQDQEDEGYVSDESQTDGEESDSNKERSSTQTTPPSQPSSPPQPRAPGTPLSQAYPPVEDHSAFRPQPRSFDVDSSPPLFQQLVPQDFPRPAPPSALSYDRQQTLSRISSHHYASNPFKNDQSLRSNHSPISIPNSSSPLDDDFAPHHIDSSSSLPFHQQAKDEAQVEYEEPEPSSFSDEEMDKNHQAPGPERHFPTDGTRRIDRDTETKGLEGKEPGVGIVGGGERAESTLPPQIVPGFQRPQDGSGTDQLERTARMDRSNDEEEDRGERNEGNGFRPARRSEGPAHVAPQSFDVHNEEEEPRNFAGSSRSPNPNDFRSSRTRQPPTFASSGTPSPVESSSLDSTPEQRSASPLDDEQSDDFPTSPSDSQGSLSPSPEPSSAFLQPTNSFTSSSRRSQSVPPPSSPSDVHTESDLSDDYNDTTKPLPRSSTSYGSSPVKFPQQALRSNPSGGEYEVRSLPEGVDKDKGYMTDESNESVGSEGKGEEDAYSEVGQDEQAANSRISLRPRDALSPREETRRGGENENTFEDEGFDETLNDTQQPRKRNSTFAASSTEQPHLQERSEESEDEGRGETDSSPESGGTFDSQPSFNDHGRRMQDLAEDESSSRKRETSEMDSTSIQEPEEERATSPLETFNPSARSSRLDTVEPSDSNRRNIGRSPPTPPSPSFATQKENDNFDRALQSLNRDYDSSYEKSRQPSSTYGTSRSSQFQAQDSNYAADPDSDRDSSFNSPPRSTDRNLSNTARRPAAPRTLESARWGDEDGYGTASDSDADDEDTAYHTQQPVPATSYRARAPVRDREEQTSSEAADSPSDALDEDQLSKPTKSSSLYLGDSQERGGEEYPASQGEFNFGVAHQELHSLTTPTLDLSAPFRTKSDRPSRSPSPSEHHTDSDFSEDGEEPTKSPPPVMTNASISAFNQQPTKSVTKGSEYDSEEEDPGYGTDESTESVQRRGGGDGEWEESENDQAQNSTRPSTYHKTRSEDFRGGGDSSQNRFEDEGYDEDSSPDSEANYGKDSFHTDSEDEDRYREPSRSRKLEQEETDPTSPALPERSSSPSEASTTDREYQADDSRPPPDQRTSKELGSVSASSVDFDNTKEPKSYEEGSDEYHTDSEASEPESEKDDVQDFEKATSNRQKDTLAYDDKVPDSTRYESATDDGYPSALPNKSGPSLSSGIESPSDEEDLSDQKEQGRNDFEDESNGQQSAGENDEDFPDLQARFGQSNGGETDQSMDYQGGQTDSSQSDFGEGRGDDLHETTRGAEDPSNSFDNEQRDQFSDESNAQSEDPASLSDQERDADQRQGFENDDSNSSFDSGRGNDNFDKNDSYGGAGADPVDRDGYGAGEDFDNLGGRGGDDQKYDGGDETNLGGGNDYTSNGATNDRDDYSDYGNDRDGDSSEFGNGEMAARGGEEYQPSPEGSSYGGEYQKSPGDLDDGYGQDSSYDGDQLQAGGNSYEPSDGGSDQNDYNDGEIDRQGDELGGNHDYEPGNNELEEDPYSREALLGGFDRTTPMPALRRFEDSLDVLHRIQHDRRSKVSDRVQKAVVEIFLAVHELRRVEEEENRTLTPIPSADDLDLDSSTYHLSLTALQDQTARTLEEAQETYQLNDSKRNLSILRGAGALNDAAIRQGRDIYLASVDAHEESLNDPAASSERVNQAAADRHFNATQEVQRASREVARAKARLKTLEDDSLRHETWEWDSRSDKRKQSELDRTQIQEARTRLRDAERRQRNAQRDLDEAALYSKNASGVLESTDSDLTLNDLNLELERHLVAVQHRYSAQLIVEEKQALLRKVYSSGNEHEIAEARQALKAAEADLKRAEEEEQQTKYGLTHRDRIDSAQLSETLAKRELEHRLQNFSDITFKHLHGGATCEDLQDAQEAVDRARSTYAAAIDHHHRAKDDQAVGDSESDHSIQERSEAAQRLLSHHEAKVKALQSELEQDSSNLSASQELEDHLRQKHLAASVLLQSHDLLLADAQRRLDLDPDDLDAQENVKNAAQSHDEAVEAERVSSKGVDRQDQLDVAKVLHDHLTRHLEEKQNELADLELNLASEREIAAAHLALDNLERGHHESHHRLEHLEDEVALHHPDTDHSVRERLEAAQHLLSHHEAKVKALQSELEQDSSNLSASQELEDHLRQKHLAASVLLQSHDLLPADAQRRLLLDPEDIDTQDGFESATQNRKEAIEAERISRKGVDRQDQLDAATLLHEHLTQHLEEKRNELDNLQLNLASEREIAAAHLDLDQLETRHHESQLRLEHLEDKVALHHTDPSKSEEENRIRHHEAAYRLRNHFRHLLLSHQRDLESAEDRYSQARLAMLEKRESEFSKYVDDLDNGADHPQRLAVARTNLDSTRSSLEIARESQRRARERHLDSPSVVSEEALRKAQTGLQAARHVHHLTKEELLSRRLAHSEDSLASTRLQPGLDGYDDLIAGHHRALHKLLRHHRTRREHSNGRRRDLAAQVEKHRSELSTLDSDHPDHGSTERRLEVAKDRHRRAEAEHKRHEERIANLDSQKNDFRSKHGDFFRRKKEQMKERKRRREKP
ncbi:hypothetical protein JCM5350_007974 [Sporobolomyces pararoseus]